MTHYDDPLRLAQRQVARTKQLQSQISELIGQKESLNKNMDQLERIKVKEQKDLDRLERNGLTAFFYNLTGKLDEKMDLERRKAMAAKVKYDTAQQELARVEKTIRESYEELEALRGCETQYALLLQEKLDAIKSSGGPHGEEILTLEEKLGDLTHQVAEVREAIKAGKEALMISTQVKEKLDSAESYSTWDILGGGMIADALKHSELDEAKQQAVRLQERLGKFRTELADVKMETSIDIDMSDFMVFADVFIDNIFTDMAVMEKITDAQTQLAKVRGQINSILVILQEKEKANLTEQENLRNQLEKLAVEV